eukprot:jgi/Tetstr1/436838/TSEL_025615.t1
MVWDVVAGDFLIAFEDADAAAFSTLAGIWGVSPDLLDTPSMRTHMSFHVQFGGIGIGDNVVIADASHIGVAALVVGHAVTFLRAQHATLSDAGAFLSEPSGVSSPHSLYLVGASSIHQAMATPSLEPDAGANVSVPMAEPASAMRSAADVQGIPHYSDFPLHSMRKVQETLSHRIHTSVSVPVTPEYYDSMFRVAVCRPYGLAAALVLSLGEPCPCAFCSFSVQGMLARFEEVGVEFTPSAWAVAYVDHVARCSGGDSNHAAHEWAAHGLSDVCHDVKSAHGVGV